VIWRERALDVAAMLVKRAGLYAFVILFLGVGIPLFFVGVALLLVIGLCVVVLKEVFR
jgi:hypothetical protein